MTTPAAAPTCDPIPMAQWVKAAGGDENGCKPCTLTPVTQWYGSELKTAGLHNLAADLVAVATALPDDDDQAALELAQELDRIKQQVPEAVRDRLLDFDCTAQQYQGEEEEA